MLRNRHLAIEVLEPRVVLDAVGLEAADALAGPLERARKRLDAIRLLRRQIEEWPVR